MPARHSRVAAPPRAPGRSGRVRLRPGREAPFDQQRPGRASINGAVAAPATPLRPGSQRPVLPRPAPARLRDAWQPRAPAGRTTCPRCPSPAPAKIWFPPSRAVEIVNRREPEAYIYRETRVPEAAQVGPHSPSRFGASLLQPLPVSLVSPTCAPRCGPLLFGASFVLL
ncbi:uncharacterized protein LOC127211958 [Acomys russatus]|uniref:uncharacterized protein LOC127211958 n=1 Tax=Acomys russatus TaxID=60746 RepID=UPI0021E3348F|nr:uncharacterized protein LOC127211958 [Acomys russatus]